MQIQGNQEASLLKATHKTDIKCSKLDNLNK